jgi:hypothetical protein
MHRHRQPIHHRFSTGRSFQSVSTLREQPIRMRERSQAASLLVSGIVSLPSISPLLAYHLLLNPAHFSLCLIPSLLSPLLSDLLRSGNNNFDSVPPTYNSRYGFQEGAQNDIFVQSDKCAIREARKKTKEGMSRRSRMFGRSI